MQRWEAAYAGFLDHVPRYTTGINAGQQTCSFRDAADGLNAAAGGTLEIALVDKEKLEAPLAALRRALTQRPEDPKAHDDLGVALMLQGRTGESIARYKRAIALRPDYADAHLNYSTALMLQGRIDEAIARYQRAVAFKLNHFDALCRSSARSGCGIEVVLAA
jgi:tetratricopeptide (TPR) repeat protein